jgi:hypothetical protein
MTGGVSGQAAWAEGQVLRALHRPLAAVVNGRYVILHARRSAVPRCREQAAVATDNGLAILTAKTDSAPACASVAANTHSLQAPGVDSAIRRDVELAVLGAVRCTHLLPDHSGIGAAPEAGGRRSAGGAP